MRQSRKEVKIENMMRQGLSPDRREALAFPETADTEFAEEWSSGPLGGSGNGRRHSPGGRG